MTRKIKERLADIESKLAAIESLIESFLQQTQGSRLPEKADAPNPLGYKKCRNHKLIGGFRDPEIRKLIISMRKQGQNYSDIEVGIKIKYPDNPEKHVSRSAIHRFCESAHKGRLREYGIDVMLNQTNPGEKA